MSPPGQVSAFDTLCEVQSDKASVEITSPFDGTVKDILVKEGEVAKVGAGLCTIEVDENEYPASDEEASSPPPQAVQEATQSEQPPAEKPQPPAQDPPKVQRKPHPLDPNVSQETKATFSTNAGNVLAAPSVRHFAKESGVDLAKLAPGSGKGGRIEKKDVEAFLAGSKVQKTAPGAQTPLQSEPAQDILVELGRTRYGMWKAMVQVGPGEFCSQFGSDLSVELADTPLRVRPQSAAMLCVVLTHCLAQLLHQSRYYHSKRDYAHSKFEHTIPVPSTVVKALTPSGDIPIFILC